MSDAEGAWVVYAWDYNPYLIAAYPDELSALRELNGLGYGEVMFLPWGMNLSDANSAKRALTTTADPERAALAEGSDT